MTESGISPVWVASLWVGLNRVSLLASMAVLMVAQTTAAAGSSSSTSATESRAEILIEDAWVRAMPPSQPNTAAYMTVRNEGDTRINIVAASSHPFSTVEIHSSREVDGMVRMERLSSVALDPGKQLQFAPGGMHLMMLGLDKMPAAGEQVKLCLQFDSGTSACTHAEVRRVAPSANDHMHENHQHH